MFSHLDFEDCLNICTQTNSKNLFKKVDINTTDGLYIQHCGLYLRISNAPYQNPEVFL